MFRPFRLLLRHLRFNPFLFPSARFNKELALNTLYRKTNRLLCEIEVEFWLDYGTLLGYFRQGGFLSNDKDIDFGAHEKEYPKILGLKKRLPKSFKMYDTSHKHRGPKLYITYQGWEADIYFYEERKGMLQNYENSKNPSETTPLSKELVYPIEKTEFLGEKTFVPTRTEAYLTHIYRYIGPDARFDKKSGYWYKKG